MTAALNGGEDYELVFTVSMDEFEKIKETLSIHPIGHITERTRDVILLPHDGFG